MNARARRVRDVTTKPLKTESMSHHRLVNEDRVSHWGQCESVSSSSWTVELGGTEEMASDLCGKFELNVKNVLGRRHY
jgi:hypothetical protein